MAVEVVSFVMAPADVLSFWLALLTKCFGHRLERHCQVGTRSPMS